MPHAVIPDDSFPPGRNEPCFCGSGRRFKQCCGSRSADRPPPHGVGIVENFLSAPERSELVGLAASLEGRRFQVLDRADNLAPTIDDTRVCEFVLFGKRQPLLDDVVARAFEEQIIPRFPSDVRYEHMAKLVKSGRRYVIVSWAAASGVERVQPDRPKRSISWETREKAPAL